MRFWKAPFASRVSSKRRSLELRAATDLAKLFVEDGKRPKVRELLAPILAQVQ